LAPSKPVGLTLELATKAETVTHGGSGSTTFPQPTARKREWCAHRRPAGPAGTCSPVGERTGRDREGAEMLLPIWLRLWNALGVPMFDFKIVR